MVNQLLQLPFPATTATNLGTLSSQSLPAGSEGIGVRLGALVRLKETKVVVFTSGRLQLQHQICGHELPLVVEHKHDN
jgi:hypothetical protein